MVEINGKEYKLICEHYQEIGLFGAGCFAPEGCPYNQIYQVTFGDLKGCNVNGLVPKSDLQKDLREKLEQRDEGLVNRVEVTKISLPTQ